MHVNPGFDPEDETNCPYCGAYQEDPEDRSTEHIAWDLVVTHRSYEGLRAEGLDVDGVNADIYDLLCELDFIAREEGR